MHGYTKLFESILTSTIWDQDEQTRIVWITMLALKNKNHVVEASVPGLARLARVPVEATRRALEMFQQPDPESRTQDFEGRRIEPVDGGWKILNGAKYDEKMRTVERSEYMRNYMAERRARAAASPAVPVEPPPGFPASVEEAKAGGMTVGCPDEFSVKVWNTAMGRGGRDAKDVAIASWPHHLAAAWRYEQERMAKGGNGGKGRKLDAKGRWLPTVQNT